MTFLDKSNEISQSFFCSINFILNFFLSFSDALQRVRCFNVNSVILIGSGGVEKTNRYGKSTERSEGGQESEARCGNSIRV
jgi:hypothetical protein